MEQSPLCYAAPEYIHSLSGAREEKRGKRCEKGGGGEIERQDIRPGAGVSIGATYLIPTGNGLRPSFAQPVGEVVPAVLATELIVEGATLLAGIVWDAHFPTCARKPR